MEPRQIGWSQEAILLHGVSKQLERLAGILAASMNTVIPVFTATVNGLVPAPGPPTGRVLTDSGAWMTVGGGGTPNLTVNGISGQATLVGSTLNIPVYTANLVYTASPTNGIITNTLGSGVTIPAATDTIAGLLTATLFTKLNTLGVFTLTVSGLVPFPTTTTGKVLSDAGTWITPPNPAIFTTSTDGLVPAPATASGRVLSDAGTWIVPPNPAVFTQTVNGLVPAPVTAPIGKVLSDNGTWVPIAPAIDLVTIIITATSGVSTATLGTGGVSQTGRNVVFDNGAVAFNFTCNGGVTASYAKHGTGAITFVAGAGRTLVTPDGTAIFNGAPGSTASLWSVGTVDYVRISNI